MEKKGELPDRLYTFPTEEMKKKEAKRTPPKRHAPRDGIELAEKKVEQALSSVGAKIADANDMSDKIQRLSEQQEEKLSRAQRQLADAYEQLGE